jgi:crossover junction endodeoxyribonuclease RusA
MTGAASSASPTTPASVRFVVSGSPVPQGSMVALANGRLRHQSSGALTAWRRAIGWTARTQMQTQPWSGPVQVTLTFTVRNDATRPPDLDKLIRAVLDALTGIVWDDDRQVVALTATKQQGAACGVAITVTEEC